MSEITRMKPGELLRRLKCLSTRRGLSMDVTEGGNHTKLRFDGRRSTIPRHSADLKPGTFRGILKQLGLTESDLED
jgi:mRNA interferase HicA